MNGHIDIVNGHIDIENGHIDIINGHTCSSSDTCGISFCTIRTRPLIFNKILSNFSKLPEPKNTKLITTGTSLPPSSYLAQHE